MELILFLIILFFAACIGNFILSIGMKSGIRDDIDRFLILPLGLAAISYIVYLLGVCSLLRIWPVISAVLILSVVCVIAAPLKIKPYFIREKFDILEKSLLTVLAAFGAITLTGALAPAIGTDSLCYHLAIPRMFIAQNKVGYIHYTINSLYPFFTEMLFMMGILLKGAVLAKLFSWGSGVIMAASAYIFAKSFSDRKTGLIAAILAISSPGIFSEMTYAYVDVALALYSVLSVFMLLVWMEHGRHYRHLIFSGVFMGAAFSIKYLAFYIFIPVFIVLIWSVFRDRKASGIIRPVVSFLIPCFCLSSFWYIKSFVVLGNPVFPVFSNFFHSPIKVELAHHFSMGTGKSILDFILLPWNMTIKPSLFGSRGSQIGAQYLILSPFIIFGFSSRKVWVRRLSFIILVYAAIWFNLVQRDRFIYPVLPLISVLIAYSGHVLWSLRSRRAAVLKRLFAALILLSVLFNLAICLYQNRRNYKVTFGLENREEYLEKWVTNYKMASFVNRELPLDSLILGIGIYKPYYFERRLVRESVFDKWERYRDKYTTSGEILSYLRSKGFTHVIYKKTGPEKMPRYVEMITHGKKPLYEYGPMRNIESGQDEYYSIYGL